MANDIVSEHKSVITFLMIRPVSQGCSADGRNDYERHGLLSFGAFCRQFSIYLQNYTPACFSWFIITTLVVVVLFTKCPPFYNFYFGHGNLLSEVRHEFKGMYICRHGRDFEEANVMITHTR